MLATSQITTFGKAPIPFGQPLAIPGVGQARAAAAGAASSMSGHLLDSFVSTSVVIRAGRDEEIIAQGEESEHCFQVISGCVRTVRLLEDGRRQVGEFRFAGDVIALEMEGTQEFSAEAATPVTVRRFRLRPIEERARVDPIFACRLRRLVADQMRVARGRLILLGRMTASERIASFLLEMSSRLRRLGTSSIELPMSRADISDYLGLTIETVSRRLTDLRRRGVIELDRTRIAVNDHRGLGIAGSDRFH
jgi:CRP-like cAMP-binding protein